MANRFDPVAARDFFAVGLTTDGTTYYQVLLKGHYAGTYTPYSPNYANTPPADGIVWTNLTPASQNLDLAAQFAAAFGSKYNPELFGPVAVDSMQDKYLIMHAGAQDAPQLIAF